MAFSYEHWLKFAHQTDHPLKPERCEDTVAYHVVEWPECFALYLRVTYERGELQVEPEK